METERKNLMKNQLSLALLAASMLLAGPAFAQDDSAKPSNEAKPIELHFRMDTVGMVQALSQKNDSNSLPKLSTGLQAALGNAHIDARLTEGIRVYAEFYLSSKAHAGTLTDREGYILLSTLPDKISPGPVKRLFNFIDVKAGHFEIDFGQQHLFRSDNADVQRNALIGNYIVDPNTVEGGVEVIGRHGPMSALVGLGNGVTVEDFQSKRVFSKHAKLLLEPANKQGHVSVSVYRADHSGTPPKASSGSSAEMFASNRSGSRYSAVLGGGAEAGQLRLGMGKDITAWQADGSANISRLKLFGLFGSFTDADTNGSDAGSPEDRWTYVGGEARFDVVSDLYVVGNPEFHGFLTEASVSFGR